MSFWVCNYIFEYFESKLIKDTNDLPKLIHAEMNILKGNVPSTNKREQQSKSPSYNVFRPRWTHS